MAFRRVVVDTWVAWGPPKASDATENIDIRFAMVKRVMSSQDKLDSLDVLC